MMRKLLFAILISLTFIYSSGQDLKYGIINDSDGYTNIRSQPDINSNVILKYHDYEIFQYKIIENSDWFMVTYYPCDFDKNYVQKYNPYTEKQGFIHKSRVVNINNIDSIKLRLVVDKLIDTELELYKAVDTMTNSNNIVNCKRISYHEFIFDTNLDLIKQYICQSKDNEIFHKYLKLLIIESGSADEAPRFTLGDIYICLPDWTIKIMEDYPSLIYDLEWGVVPYIHGKNDKESLKHKQRLSGLREKFKLEKVDYDQYY